jgi:hypothetical protein
MQLYLSFIENEIKKFYNTLSEKAKRLYAAVEALKIGHGGISYIARIVGCSRKTVARGIRELNQLPNDDNSNDRIRKPGGGRKPYYEKYNNINEQFLDILIDHTAGDPSNKDIIWTNLTPKEIADRIAEKYTLGVSETVIRKLMEKHNYRRRKALKSEPLKTVKHKNEQFENITIFKRSYEPSDNPIISIDTKKKEYLGNFYRAGHLYTKEIIKTFDHDFISFAKGIIIPHGIYDLKLNIGYINLGISKDTSEFACDSLKFWWNNYGRYNYPRADSILTYCDCGGSNSSRHYLFKQDLQQLVNDIGVPIRIAHYPPYTSKYNPIEHRLFPHVTRACQGVVFKNIEIVKELMEKAKTKTGLKVIVNIIDKEYQTGRTVSNDFKQNMSIIFDDYLPDWNYQAVPIPLPNG